MGSRALFGLPTAAAGASTRKLKLGIMTSIGAKDTLGLTKTLHAEAVRRAVFTTGPQKWTGSDDFIDHLQKHNRKIVLTIRNGGTSDYDPSYPPSDMKVYKATLRAILEEHRPKVAVIENEMSGSTMYTGTASQYLAQLEAAAEVVSEFSGIKLADGGLPGAVVRDMTYQHILTTAGVESAEDFARRATSTEDEYTRTINGSSYWAPIGHSFLDGFADAGADFVNFHWYETDGLGKVADFLEQHTGLKPISNEVGVRSKSDSEGQKRLLKQAKGKLLYFIQYSIDLIRRNDPARTVYALQDESLKLRPTGEVYKEFATGL